MKPKPIASKQYRDALRECQLLINAMTIGTPWTMRPDMVKQVNRINRKIKRLI